MPINAEYTDIRGAVYFPHRALNVYQVWWQFDRQQVARDLDGAAALGLNCLRVFLSYDYWLEDFDGDETAANQHYPDFAWLLDEADARDIRILPVLFESIGDDPYAPDTDYRDTNIETSFALHSPSESEFIEPRNWVGYAGSPTTFVRQMVSRHDAHPAVIAWESMNEPGTWNDRVDFAQDMLEIVSNNGSKPLTIGFANLDEYDSYTDPPVDIIQFHNNIPPQASDFEADIAAAEALRDSENLPVWCTEWQRTIHPEPPSRFLPDYENAAGIFQDAVAQSRIDGQFFWQLCFQPAYIEAVRRQGRLNGVFHEDGRVFDRGDAEALAGGSVARVEHQYIPSWIFDADFPWRADARDGGHVDGMVLVDPPSPDPDPDVDAWTYDGEVAALSTDPDVVVAVNGIDVTGREADILAYYAADPGEIPTDDSDPTQRVTVTAFTSTTTETLTEGTVIFDDGTTTGVSATPTTSTDNLRFVDFGSTTHAAAFIPLAPSREIFYTYDAASPTAASGSPGDVEAVPGTVDSLVRLGVRAIPSPLAASGRVVGGFEPSTVTASPSEAYVLVTEWGLPIGYEAPLSVTASPSEVFVSSPDDFDLNHQYNVMGVARTRAVGAGVAHVQAPVEGVARTRAAVTAIAREALALVGDFDHTVALTGVVNRTDYADDPTTTPRDAGWTIPVTATPAPAAEWTPETGVGSTTTASATPAAAPGLAVDTDAASPTTAHGLARASTDGVAAGWANAAWGADPWGSPTG